MGTRYKPASGTASDADLRALNALIALLRSSDSVSQKVNRHLSDYDLTTRQFAVLEALYYCGNLMQNALAQKLLCTPGNLTGVVSKLVHRKLVTSHALEDKRCREIRISAAGRALIEKIFPKHVNVIRETFAVLSPREQESLRALCRKLGLSCVSSHKV